VSSIAEEKEERSIYAETCSETEGEGTTSDTSVNVSEQQSENTASSGPALWPSTNKNLVLLS
jgi:adenosylcobinamide amidohydrolase